MASGTPITRSLVIKSIPSAARQVSNEILSELRNNNFSEEDVFAIQLAIEEAFINAIKHGNQMDDSKQIKVDYFVGPDKTEISLTDEGQGFDPNSIPDPRCGKNLYKTNGRGLLLMRSYMDVVEYNQQGNCVRMVRYKEKPRLT